LAGTAEKNVRLKKIVYWRTSQFVFTNNISVIESKRSRWIAGCRSTGEMSIKGKAILVTGSGGQ
jgi:hypothetical protein